VELVVQVVAPAMPAHPGLQVGEPDPAIPGKADAPSLDEGCVEDDAHLLGQAPPEEHDDLLVYDSPKPLGFDQPGGAAEDGVG